jgi:hypothetical protein
MQRRWIEEHGGDVLGYIARYGEDVGRRLYAADRARLLELADGLPETSSSP